MKGEYCVMTRCTPYDKGDVLVKTTVFCRKTGTVETDQGTLAQLVFYQNGSYEFVASEIAQEVLERQHGTWVKAIVEN